ncbi:DJ-1/PfpI family protein [Streptomyces lunaelactis]|uniref:GlxA family transcriptional regulator n=1 Tax=Streptomyces lunaelactis TaxID=1535768 RepID=UPI001584D8F9|nr:DJ-1/PfpI family protein [Streptomyces lunaelactis]NUK00294.1 DJ-1/PfpI family protein [Streptomyces lunaelactis]NUK18789.1 DJ-1/PfpI family protein [Streptomyces lunaelactis]NUK27286.1 DJ-1/PfpI family protein [Streptomyces lunaelactis]NUK37613.1 DJ-1/PfpI family protein [Streptomyces lunaelactis]NUK45476.1 DJ-1/PfpI family protein [Streptomyces lunaelactis]
MSHIVFFLVPGVHLLDLAGPAQVFSTAADFGHPYTLAYIAEQPQVSTAQGLPLVAGLDWPELGPEDLIVVPGWRPGTLAGGAAIGAASLQVLRDHHARGGTVASVCAGAEALGQAGLLDGRHCTTHHDVQDELALRHPRAVVVRDVLFTADDRVITSAGIASGIDLALHLVATRHGPAVAAQVARRMVVYARRNGHEPQSSAMLRHRSHLDDTVHRAQDLIDARFDQPLPLPTLAAAVGVSERTLTRLFRRATGLTPLRYQQTLRLERAQHFISHGATIDAAARSVGFEDPRMLRRLRARTA